MTAVVLSLPLSSRAQQRRPYRIAAITIAPARSSAHLKAAFEDGLRERGYVIGRDVIVEVRSADGDVQIYPKLVDEVVRSKPDLIFSGTNANTAPAAAATKSIPIVFAVGTEVIQSGFVQSLARPGGNMTGITWDVGEELVSKRFELFKEMVPRMSRVAVFWEPPYGQQYRATTDATAKKLGVSTFWREYSGDVDADFAEIVRGRGDGVYVHHGVRLFSQRQQVAAAATRHRLPIACGSAELVDAGALMSYGPNLADSFRQAATYADKILKGAKPGDLAVEQPRKMELAVNAGTAKLLGLALSQSLRLRVDKLVE
jgi:putative ABC transport system substrate-binding protein